MTILFKYKYCNIIYTYIMTFCDLFKKKACFVLFFTFCLCLVSGHVLAVMKDAKHAWLR